MKKKDIEKILREQMRDFWENKSGVEVSEKFIQERIEETVALAKREGLI